MFFRISVVATALLLSGINANAQDVEVFTLGSGETVNATRHAIIAPIDYGNSGDGEIALDVVVLNGAGDNIPTLFLAGGPGESAINNAQQYLGPVFAELLSTGDIILADQRGTGGSGAVAPCFSDEPPTPSYVSDTRFYAQMITAMIRDCQAQWAASGIDPNTWNNSSSVADIEQILDTLGFERVNILAFSYGTSLAQRVLDELGDRIERVVLVSASDTHALKSPRDTDAFFQRLDEALLEAGATSEPLSAIMRRVHDRLNAAPVWIEMDQGEQPYTLTISGQDVQLLASFMTSDPSSARFLADLYRQVDDGDLSQLAPMIAQFRASPIPIMPMTLATQAATGAPAAIEALYLAEAEGSVLGQTMHFPVSDAFTVDDFRREMNVEADTFSPLTAPYPHATLLLSGSLDGRTTLETQRRVGQDFSNIQQVVVVNGGHNILSSSEEAVARIVDFLENGSTYDAQIALPFP